MTQPDLSNLSPAALDALYASLTATALPVGSFSGKAWGLNAKPWPFWLFVNHIWGGKVFTGDRVKNRILGQLRIEGEVTLEGRDVEIWYPQLKLRDILRPLASTFSGRRGVSGDPVYGRTSKYWLGKMQAGSKVAWFTLEQE